MKIRTIRTMELYRLVVIYIMSFDICTIKNTFVIVIIFLIRSDEDVKQEW